jgi:hypothetical protein
MRKKLVVALVLSLAALGISAGEARAGWEDALCQGKDGKAVACCTHCNLSCGECTAGPVGPVNPS